jgi:glycosyltransferase involved in cell wall biosynthesis
MRKIIIFSPIFYPDIGGPAVQGKYLAELLANNGYKVTVIKYNSSFSDYLHKNITIISLNWNSTSRYLRIARWLVSPFYALYFLIKIRPNLFLSNSVFLSGMIFGLIYKLFRIPTIIKFAGDWVSESTNLSKSVSINYQEVYKYSFYTRLMFFIQKFFLQQFSVIWVISEYRAKNVHYITNDYSKIWVQNNFHNLPFTTVGKVKSDCLVFLTASRLVPHKRIDLILQAFQSINLENYIFIICGGGQELEKLKTISNKFDKKNKVFYVGEVGSDLLHEIFTISDIYISWSAEEGAPNVFIEAMNSGLGIVSSNVGGVSEMFVHENSKILLDPESVYDLKKTIESLISDRLLVSNLQNNSRKEFIKFSLEENKIKVLKKFDSL